MQLLEMIYTKIHKCQWTTHTKIHKCQWTTHWNAYYNESYISFCIFIYACWYRGFK